MLNYGKSSWKLALLSFCSPACVCVTVGCIFSIICILVFVFTLISTAVKPPKSPPQSASQAHRSLGSTFQR